MIPESSIIEHYCVCSGIVLFVLPFMAVMSNAGYTHKNIRWAVAVPVLLPGTLYLVPEYRLQTKINTGGQAAESCS